MFAKIFAKAKVDLDKDLISTKMIQISKSTVDIFYLIGISCKKVRIEINFSTRNST